MNPATIRTVFRYVAIAEAVSWLGLLVAMLCKWVLQDDPHASPEGGVPIMGPIHGTVFLIYVAVSIVAWVQLRWTTKTGLLALAASIPPFFTIWFETWADRKGLLTKSDQAPTSSAP
ncbi:MAG: rane protein [Aeromicrobium sp.]|nr:rane protein [Aeromicrobium sp.]